MSQDVGEMLRGHRLRVTPQRRAILQAFQGDADEHLSAEDVLIRARATLPDISRATVYSTLAELTELAVLMSVGTPEPTRYELGHGPHDHFRCRLCRRLSDIERGDHLPFASLPGRIVERVILRIEGICEECVDYERGLRESAAAVLSRPILSNAQIDELACRVYSSPLGSLGLAASNDGIVRIAFDDHADFDELMHRAGRRRGPLAARERLNLLTAELDAYFAGDSATLSEPSDLRGFDPPAVAALRATRDIPYATARSYDQLDLAIEAYSRGYAMGSNPVPLLYPCHRVSRGASLPDAYVGGSERRRILHQLETSNKND